MPIAYYTARERRKPWAGCWRTAGLVVRGVEVVHILDAGESRPHELHPAARRAGGTELVYPDPSPRQLELFGPR